MDRNCKVECREQVDLYKLEKPWMKAREVPIGAVGVRVMWFPWTLCCSACSPWRRVSS